MWARQSPSWRSVGHARLRLARRRPALGAAAAEHCRDLLARLGGRSQAGGAARIGAAGRAAGGADRAAAPSAGLALRPLLLLRLRRLRRARGMAATLCDGGLRP